MKCVYLAGPITGLTYDEAVGWREDVAGALLDEGWRVRSPMRAKEHLRTDTPLIDTFDGGRAAFLRDLWDIDHCDAVLANFGVHADGNVSVGTVSEIGYAYAQSKWIVAVMDEGSPYNRLFLREMASAVVPSLEDGVAVLAGL
jgi:nucleoside 2-deoxyribosyltransferase